MRFLLKCLVCLAALSAVTVQSSTHDEHWAYIAPGRREPPEVRDRAWPRIAIDRFILAKLESEGMRPSPEADRHRLLRRVSLDLTGLPPTPEELAVFIADRSQDAYERAVDRLLGSPHYGERWARLWLDLARYADSNGHEKDSLRQMWKYRDWVIDAFNRDLPFDRFTIEQLAGDMLPSATRDQIIATGFHRNTMLNQEGGIDPEEARYETLVDRTNTTATVWLGTTLACAQCHNHKYDPFSQKDYFRFYAFFEGSEYEIGYSSPGDQNSRFVKEPEITLATPEQETRRLQIDTELKQLDATLKHQTPDLDRAQMDWERDLRDAAERFTPLDPITVVAVPETTLTRQPDLSIIAEGAGRDTESYVITARTTKRGMTGLRLEALADPRLPQGGPGRDPYGNFLLTGVEIETGTGRKVPIKDVRVDDSAYRFEAERFLRTETLNAAVDTPRGWYVNATRDQVRRDRLAVFSFAGPVGGAGGTTLKITLKFEGGSIRQGIGRFRLSVTDARNPLQLATVPARLRPYLALAPEARSTSQRTEISALFRSQTPLLAAPRRRAAKLREELRDLGIVSAMVFRERNPVETPTTFLRERGSFLSRGARLTAGVPAYLPPLPSGKTANRLALAEWLVDERNPLVARVTVNRFWEQIFGRGLVETSEDFGLQGSPPSHPELLDWLATEFIRNKWSVKSLLRLIVTSAAYRQSSSATPVLLERDPYNRLLARGPRFRIEAEMVRDTALVASGLLSRKIGGPSVFPPQPEGIWRNPYSGAKWTTSRGEDRYRRSLYTFIRRTSPYPSLMTFDATSREYCTVRRVRTNTPLQALTTLNDQAFFEMARAMAERILKEGGAGNRQRLAYGWQLATSRPAKPEELERLERYFGDERGRFLRNPAAARRVCADVAIVKDQAAIAERAAWTMVANVLLNLDEALTKE